MNRYSICLKSLNILCLIILIALEPNNMIKSCLAASKVQVTLLASKMQPILSNWQETILNTVVDSTLVVHFKSNGNDLDEHVINARGNYNGNFKENILQTTLFWWNFNSKYGQATNNVSENNIASLVINVLIITAFGHAWTQAFPFIIILPKPIN